MPKRIPLAVSLVLLLGMAAPAWAIPAFARRYEVACHFCHEGFPKLNSMGQRFKERGFRLEKEDEFDFDRWLRSIPADLRATGTRFIFEDAEDGTVGFLKPISAGNVGTRLAYWVDWGLILRSDSLTPPGEDNVELEPVDNAWARVEVLRDTRLYAKAGRFELDLPFSQVRTPNLFSYEIFTATTGFETDTISERQDGLELGGDLPGDLHWSAAVVKGRDSENVDELDLDHTDRFEANVFLRLVKRAGRNRFGAFGYIGRNHLAAPGVSTSENWEDDILRLGVDGSVWASRFNVYGVAMYGRNSNSIATPDQPDGTGEALDFKGGFLQADFHARDDFAITARLNVVNGPFGGTEDHTRTSFYPGVRFFVTDQLRLAFEYGFLNRGRLGHGAVQADIAF